MNTTGSKFFFGLSGAAFLAAIVYSVSTGGHLWGALSFGYKEAVGDHLGYSILIGLAIAGLFLGWVSVAFRDADADVVASLMGSEMVPEVSPPRTVSYWPVLSAFAIGLCILGVATTPILLAIGAILLVVCALEWTISAWADRASGDPEVNQLVRNRLMRPLEIPLLGVAAIGFIVLSFSRILLALSKTNAVVIGLVFAALVMVAAFLLAYRTKLNRNVVVGVVALGAVAILATGVVGAVMGEREFHDLGEEIDGTHADGDADHPSSEGDATEEEHNS